MAGGGVSIFKRTKKDTAVFRELPGRTTRIDLVTAERGPRTIETTLTLDQIEDLIRGTPRTHWQYRSSDGYWLEPYESETPDSAKRCAEELGTAYRHVTIHESIQTYNTDR